MVLILLSSLFLFVNSASSLVPQPQSDLTRLFSGIENCDLFITHSGMPGSGLSFYLFLPTILHVSWRKGGYGMFFDVTKIRSNACRIVYASGNLAIRYGLFNEFMLQPYKYWTRDGTWEGFQGLSSRIFFFPLAFSDDNKVILEMTRDIGESGLEFLGFLKIRKDLKLEICLIVVAFKIQTEYQACVTVEGENNVLEILQKGRQKGRQTPREWFTTGEHLGMSQDYENSDITALKQGVNPMNRLLKMHSVHLDHILTVFTKANASLIFWPSSYFNSSRPWFNFGEGRFMFRTDNGESLIMTEVGGYSFLTCYSKNSITFDFYVTPFHPELWVGLLVSYILLSFFLSLWLFSNKIKSSFCPWLYLLGGLLEDGVPITGKIEKRSVFRLVFGCWIIVGVLFSNCYNGLMITGLNSPLKAASVTRFKDLVCDWQEVKYSYKELGKNFTGSHFDLIKYVGFFYG